MQNLNIFGLFGLAFMVFAPTAWAQSEMRILFSSEVSKHVLVQRSSQKDIWFEECRTVDDAGSPLDTPADCERLSLATLPQNPAAVNAFNRDFTRLFDEYSESYAKENRPDALRLGFLAAVAGGLGGFWAGVRAQDLSSAEGEIAFGKIFRPAGWGALAAATLVAVWEGWNESSRRDLYRDFNPLEKMVRDRSEIPDHQFLRFYEDAKMLLIEALEDYKMI